MAEILFLADVTLAILQGGAEIEKFKCRFLVNGIKEIVCRLRRGGGGTGVVVSKGNFDREGSIEGVVLVVFINWGNYIYLKRGYSSF